MTVDLKYMVEIN